MYIVNVIVSVHRKTDIYFETVSESYFEFNESFQLQHGNENEKIFSRSEWNRQIIEEVSMLKWPTKINEGFSLHFLFYMRTLPRNIFVQNIFNHCNWLCLVNIEIFPI